PVSFQYLYESISALCRFALSFFFNDPATTEIYTLSLHDALPIFAGRALDLRVHAVARLRRGLLPASAPVRNRVTHGLPLQDGEQVLLIDQRGKRHLIFLRKSETFHSDRGWIPHDNVIDEVEGTWIRSSLGLRYLAL